MIDLLELGFGPALESQLKDIDPGGIPAKVAADCGVQYEVWSEAGPRRAEVRRRSLREAGARPAVGDWVVLRPTTDPVAEIIGVLARRTALIRRAAGAPVANQVLAANIDTVFVVSSLNRDFNPRRIERYLTVVWEGGATPVIVLNKSDLVASPGPFLSRLGTAAQGVPTHVVSGRSGAGVEHLRAYANSGETVALVGSSGVGKSTLINALAGEDVQTVQQIRRGDDHGRHTTTTRQLLRLPGRGLVVDTPGMRELGLWLGGEGVEQVFAEIHALARQCAFRDCRHQSEPGCAVRLAIDGGELDEGELHSFRKLKRELAHQERRVDESLLREHRRRWKRVHRMYRERTQSSWKSHKG